MKFAKKPILNFFFLKTGNEKELSILPAFPIQPHDYQISGGLFL